MTLRFDDPAWLWLLLLGVPALVISLRWLGTMSPIRRLSVALTRILLILLLVAMLAGASTVRTTDRVAVIAVLDVSGSVARFAAPLADPQGVGVSAPDAARRFVTVATGGRGPDDLVGAVAFASGPLAVLAPARAAPLPDDLPTTSPEGTDISAALRLARAMIPPDAAGRIVLVSDGNQTGGDALAVARELAAAQPPVRVDVVPIRYEVRAEVVLESLQAPAQAPQGSTITLRAVLASTASSTGTLRLLEEGQPVDISPGQPGDGRRISLAPGRHVEVITLPLGPRRVHRFEAIYEPDPLAPADGAGAPPAFAGDTVLANNRGQAFTLTPGTGAVLVADGVSGAAPGPGALLPRTLQDEGLEVQVVAPEGIPGDLLALEAFDLVILQNVPAESVPPEVRRLLALYVTELGGGLVMVGGHDSFGAGGWIGSELEPILPVHLDLPDTLVVPPAAIMLVLDNSGSMNRRLMGSARTQQEIANEGAALAVASMDRSDLVGVIAFNSVHSTLVPLGPNADPERTSRVIRSIGSGGGTEIRGALEEAHRQLRQAKAQIKHIVLLTDGIAPDAEQLPALAERLAADGIAVSAIAVGDAADTVNLPMMARRSGGTYYRVNDPNVLPRIFLKAVRVVRTPMVREGRFEPAVRPGSPLVEGL
ncbi:MAG TPA: VWA domain-containing protein, partial [Phycisphaerales bacterium]|nr:VWA domain-containing protein [Phycisphaerales bacterium]